MAEAPDQHYTRKRPKSFRNNFIEVSVLVIGFAFIARRIPTIRGVPGEDAYDSDHASDLFGSVHEPAAGYNPSAGADDWTPDDVSRFISEESRGRVTTNLTARRLFVATDADLIKQGVKKEHVPKVRARIEEKRSKVTASPNDYWEFFTVNQKEANLFNIYALCSPRALVVYFYKWKQVGVLESIFSETMWFEFPMVLFNPVCIALFVLWLLLPHFLILLFVTHLFYRIHPDLVLAYAAFAIAPSVVQIRRISAGCKREAAYLSEARRIHPEPLSMVAHVIGRLVVVVPGVAFEEACWLAVCNALHWVTYNFSFKILERCWLEALIYFGPTIGFIHLGMVVLMRWSFTDWLVNWFLSGKARDFAINVVRATGFRTAITPNELAPAGLDQEPQ